MIRARVRTYDFDGRFVEGEISGEAASDGSFDVILDNGFAVRRYRQYLVPLDEEARRLLGIEGSELQRLGGATTMNPSELKAQADAQRKARIEKAVDDVLDQVKGVLSLNPAARRVEVSMQFDYFRCMQVNESAVEKLRIIGYGVEHHKGWWGPDRVTIWGWDKVPNGLGGPYREKKE